MSKTKIKTNEQSDYKHIQVCVGEVLLTSECESPRPHTISSGKKKLRKFQQQALHFMVYREMYGLKQFLPSLQVDVRGGGLCSPTGTGKTFIATMLCATNLLDTAKVIALAPTITTRQYVPITLVVCPAVIMSHWGNEIKDAWPTASVYKYERTKSSNDNNLFRCVVGAQHSLYVNVEALKANSFVLMSWDYLARELQFTESAEGRRTRQNLEPQKRHFSLADFCFGRIIFDEAQFAGNPNTQKFIMCSKKLESVYRWYQSATPTTPKRGLKAIFQFLQIELKPRVKWSDEEETVKAVASVMWSHTRQQVKSQMLIPRIIETGFPIAFSVVEREYYTLAKLRDCDKQDFCKGYSMDEITLTLAVIEALRHDLNLEREFHCKQMYNSGLQLYFGQKEYQCGYGMQIIQAALELATHTTQGMPLSIHEIVDFQNVSWKETIATLISTLLFMQRQCISLKPNNQSLEQLTITQTTNEMQYIELSAACTNFRKNAEMIPQLYVQFYDLLAQCRPQEKVKCEELMSVWLTMVDLNNLKILSFYDDIYINQDNADADEEGLDQKHNDDKKQILSPEYDELHHQLNQLILCDTAYVESTKQQPLKYKLKLVCSKLRREFAFTEVSKDKLRYMEQYCARENSRVNGNQNYDYNLHLQKHFQGVESKQSTEWAKLDAPAGMKLFDKESKRILDNCVYESPQQRYEYCKTLLQDMKNYRQQMNAARDCVHVIQQLRKTLRSGLDPDFVLKKRDVVLQKKLRLCMRTMQASLLPLLDLDDAHSTFQNLGDKVKHFAEVAPGLYYGNNMKCQKCFEILDYRGRPPYRFEQCEHVICISCEEVRVRTCPEPLHVECIHLQLDDVSSNEDALCIRCGIYPKNGSAWNCGTVRCGECELIAFACCSVCDVPSKRRASCWPESLTLSGDCCFQEQEEYSKKFNQQQAKKMCCNIPYMNGSKINAVTKLIFELCTTKISEQADGTHFTESLCSYRKVLVFDSNVDFQRQVQCNLKTKQETQTFDTFLLERKQSVSQEQTIKSFNECKRSAVLFLDILETAGLHLVVADSVILCSPCLDPAITSQAQERAHRFGQLRPVSVYHCFIENSIEHDIYRLADSARQLQKDEEKEEEAENQMYQDTELSDDETDTDDETLKLTKVVQSEAYDSIVDHEDVEVLMEPLVTVEAKISEHRDKVEKVADDHPMTPKGPLRVKGTCTSCGKKCDDSAKSCPPPALCINRIKTFDRRMLRLNKENETKENATAGTAAITTTIVTSQEPICIVDYPQPVLYADDDETLLGKEDEEPIYTLDHPRSVSNADDDETLLGQEDEEPICTVKHPRSVSYAYDETLLGQGDEDQEICHVVEQKETTLQERPIDFVPIQKIDTEVQRMLQDLRIPEYEVGFTRDCYEELRDLDDLSDVDFERLQIPHGKRARIRGFIREHKSKRCKIE